MSLTEPAHLSQSIPQVAYSFVGVEAFVLAAFEARSIWDIAIPSRWLHWIVLVLYLLCTIGIILTVSWTNPNLPSIRGGRTPPNDAKTNSAVVLAALDAGRTGTAVFFNAALIYSILSTANTAMYNSSRTLYGMTYKIQGNTSLSRRFRRVSRLEKKTKVPAVAMFCSLLSFGWLPILHWILTATGNDLETLSDVIEIVQLTSSVSCFIVWFSLCLAYHRFDKW